SSTASDAPCARRTVEMALVRFYLLANALLALATVTLLVVRAVSGRSRRPLSYRQQLHLACALIVAAIAGSLLAPPAGSADIVPAVTQVWAAPSMSAVTVLAGNLDAAMVSAGISGTSMPLGRLMLAVAATGLLGVVLAIGRIFVGAWSMRRVLARAHLVR